MRGMRSQLANFEALVNQRREERARARRAQK